MFLLVVTCGVQAIEIRISDIKDIKIFDGEDILYIQPKGKGEKSRHVKLPLETKEAIDRYLEMRFDDTEYSCEFPLFASTNNNNNGGRMTTNSISKSIRTRMVDASYRSDRLTSHITRYKAAMINMLEGGTEADTRNLLGHTKPDTTKIYTHMMERKRNMSENRIANAIFPKS